MKIFGRIRWCVEFRVALIKGVNRVCPENMVELSWLVELPVVELTGADRRVGADGCCLHALHLKCVHRQTASNLSFMIR